MIRIFRLKNGEDIIGVISAEPNDQKGNITISEPMAVGIENRKGEAGLVMQHWLPVQLITKNETVLNLQDVLTMFEPNAEFTEYYINTVEKINELLKAKKIADEMSDEEL